MTQTTDRDDLAAKYFPDSWTAAQEPGKSKKRNQLRNAAENMQKKECLRSQGASCANCSYLGTAQLRGKTEMICELDSDFHGYSLTKPEHLCHRWTEKKNDKAD